MELLIYSFEWQELSESTVLPEVMKASWQNLYFLSIEFEFLTQRSQAFCDGFLGKIIIERNVSGETSREEEK